METKLDAVQEAVKKATKRVGGKSVITKLSLDKLYGKHSTYILREYLDPLKRINRKEKRKYFIISELPGAVMFANLEKAHFTTTLTQLVGGAFDEIESLAEEMRSWHDGMPENLQDGNKGCEVSEAAEALEGISRVELDDLIEGLGDYKLVYRPLPFGNSRSSRACEAASQLRGAMEAMREIFDALKIAREILGDKVNVGDDELSEIEACCVELDEAAETVEGVNFPGMY